MKNNIAVELQSVTKRYIIHHEKPTLVEKFIRDRNESFTALENINLKIKKGEKLGIIGANGSGKTTLLKIICGITRQTSGTVVTNGKIVSLIDLEAGFHPDLNGEQNIYLNGMLLGMSKKEIRDKFMDIVSFADIRQFIDTPLYTYSEGMKLRIGFAVAVHADPDILLLDENISVGDENFQKKSQKKIKEMFRLGKTIIIVSHWLNFIKKNCNRVIIIRDGRIIEDGTGKLINKYQEGIL